MRKKTWRDVLSYSEFLTVKKYERAMKTLREKQQSLVLLRAEKNLITNRAIQRAKLLNSKSSPTSRTEGEG